MTLNAHWRPRTFATFNNGTSVNTKMKQLSNSTKTGRDDNNDNIKYIRKSNTILEENKVATNNVSSTDIPIYMWYDANTIYYYSEADDLYLNATASYMFNCLQALEEVDTYFKTDFTTTTLQMFYNCRALKNLDVSGFNTSKVTNMASMFGNLKNLSILNLSNFDTQKVTTMNNMFNGSEGITELNISNFDTKKLTTMTRMFSSMKKLQVLDISSFDTSKVTSMEKAFDNMDVLTTIYASDSFIVKTGANTNLMFNNDNKLVGGNGTKYSSSNPHGEYARIDTNEHPGYFSIKN